VTCVIYLRCSKADGSQDIETQRLALEAEAKRRGWTVAAIESDLVSGDPARRNGRTPPGLARALDRIERRKASILLVFAADRIVRSAVGLLHFVQRVQAAGGRVCSARDGADLDTTTEQGELLLFLQGWFAPLGTSTHSRTYEGRACSRPLHGSNARPSQVRAPGRRPSPKTD
jgi:DNA invertase Pin-like site-specific DNA recombinase